MKRAAWIIVALLAAFLLAGRTSLSVAEQSGTSLEHGERLYRNACAACHGVRGDGQGPAAKNLFPKPRDFTQANFRLRSTRTGKLPLDEDLDRTLREGIPGTSMPAWGEILSASDRAAIIEYMKTLSPAFGSDARMPKPEDVIARDSQRPFPVSEESITRGSEVYKKMRCALCHGIDGRGDGSGVHVLTDDVDAPLSPPDFHRGVYKSGGTDAGLYKVITTGPDGTEMLGYEKRMTEEERWQVVDYIRSLKKERSPLVRFLLERPGE